MTSSPFFLNNFSTTIVHKMLLLGLTFTRPASLETALGKKHVTLFFGNLKNTFYKKLFLNHLTNILKA